MFFIKEGVLKRQFHLDNTFHFVLNYTVDFIILTPLNVLLYLFWQNCILTLTVKPAKFVWNWRHVMYVKNIILKSKNESYIWEVLSSGAFNHDAEGVVLTIESVVEILKCDHSNETYWAVLYIIYWTRLLAIHLLIFACELSLEVWSLKWKLLRRTFTYIMLYQMVLVFQVMKQKLGKVACRPRGLIRWPQRNDFLALQVITRFYRPNWSLPLRYTSMKSLKILKNFSPGARCCSI